MIVYAAKKPDICPYCHRGKFLRAPREETQPTIQQTVIVQQAQPEVRPSTKYCKNCGAKITENSKYCDTCGSELS